MCLIHRRHVRASGEYMFDAVRRRSVAMPRTSVCASETARAHFGELVCFSFPESTEWLATWSAHTEKRVE